MSHFRGASGNCSAFVADLQSPVYAELCGADNIWPSQVRNSPSLEKPLIAITDATSPSQLDAVRDLMRAFMAWHRERHTQDLHLIDAYFDAASFEEELATLPGAYSPPSGRLLLATVEGEPAGCVALRRIDDQYCEMKRMFVYPHFRGRGLGLALSQKVVEHARSSGYRAMRLDTSIRQAEAKALYSRLGFNAIPPYYDLPADLRDWLVFMELTL
jgi:GNAT superfamily N-acetyltransferase